MAFDLQRGLMVGRGDMGSGALSPQVQATSVAVADAVMQALQQALSDEVER